MTAPADSVPCVVCGGDTTPAMSAECNWCDGRYHFNQRNDVDARDCGYVWIDEQYMALQFACENCFTPRQPADAARAQARSGALARRRRYRRRE